MSIRGTHTWEGSCSAGWPFLLMKLGLAMALVFFALGLILPAVIALLATIPITAFTKIRVTCSDRGLTIKYGALRWPTQTIALDRIDKASAIDVNPVQWGGWGYRGSLRLFKRAAVNLRKGPGIRLDLKRGRTFVVTVDEPALGVNVLNQAIVMRPPPRDGK